MFAAQQEVPTSVRRNGISGKFSCSGLAGEPLNMIELCHVYQKSTKKAVNPLGYRGLTAFQFLGRLPDVYHSHFLMPKEGFSVVSSQVFALFNPMQEA